ncbi:MAG: hypothetical protein RMJ83_05995, partial [Armatimonadota bacterium]|nr:hypothetical protein [Armatimonadota bacterium]
GVRSPQIELWLCRVYIGFGAKGGKRRQKLTTMRGKTGKAAWFVEVGISGLAPTVVGKTLVLQQDYHADESSLRAQRGGSGSSPSARNDKAVYRQQDASATKIARAGGLGLE